MHLYIIKKDGYVMSQAQGKHKAIKRLLWHLQRFNDHSTNRWDAMAGTIYCFVTTGTYEETYTIERMA